ncbi:MAG: hypothetical protein NVS4B2_23190 [Chloroflexota bacterium]
MGADKRGLSMFCVERNWAADRRYSGSIRPVIELISNMGLLDLNERPPIHRDVCTRAEFVKLVDEWAGQYDDYKVAYFASHGDAGAIILDEDDDEYVSLEELGALLDGTCHGRVPFLGGCATLHVSRQEIDELFRSSGARAICGYEKPVDTIAAAALETAFFGTLAQKALTSSRLGDGLPAFEKTRFYRSVGVDLGFWIWHDR